MPQAGGAHFPGQAQRPPIPGIPAPQAPVPPFMQKPAAPAVDARRDPFAISAQTMTRVSQMPAAMAYQEEGVFATTSDAGTGRKRILLIIAGLVIPLFVLGYSCGSSIDERIQYNIALDDAKVIQYQMMNAKKVLDELQPTLNQALDKSTRREFDDTHLSYIEENIKGSPLQIEALTVRNFHIFQPTLLNNLLAYFNGWTQLIKALRAHVRSTRNDETMIKGAKGEELVNPQYGVVFASSEAGFLANVVFIGNPKVESKDVSTYDVQPWPSYETEERSVYMANSPEPLIKEVDKWVVPIDSRSKQQGPLAGIAVSDWTEYANRLAEIGTLLKDLSAAQATLLAGLDDVSKLSPRFVIGRGSKSALEKPSAKPKK